MSGNAAEWCWDWMGYWYETYDKNPQGCERGSYAAKMVLGGSWYSGAPADENGNDYNPITDTKVFNRNADYPSSTNNTGLRLVRMF